MADNYCLSFSQGIKEANHITNQVKQRILVDTLRPIGLSVTAHVGSNCAKPGFGKSAQLMAPRIPRFWKAMA